MRIALLAPPFLPLPPVTYGGIERVVYELGKELAHLGHYVVVAAPEGSSIPGCEVFPLDRTSLKDLSEQEATEAANNAALRASNALQSRVDIVHNNTRVHLPGHGIHTLHSPATLADTLSAKTSEWRFVSLSADHQAQCLEFGIPTTVIFNGIPVREFPFSSLKMEYLLFLGDCRPDKGPDIAIRVSLATSVPLLMGMMIRPAFRGYYNEHIQPYLSPQIQDLGNIGGVHKNVLLASARALIMPSLWREPFGLVALESMSCGTPVIALKNGAIPEIVEDGITGILCSSEDEMISRLPEVYSLSPVQCRESAKRFSVTRMTESYLQLYREENV